MKKMIVCLTVKETVQLLKEHGFKITEQHLRAGLECGAYPFGDVVKMAKSPCFEIFRPKLMEWINERSEDIEQ